MKLKQNFNLTQNFTVNEFLSDLDKEEISFKDFINLQNLADKLQKLRDVVGSIDITKDGGGFRGIDFNKSIGGTVSPPSYHTQGLAADIKFDFSIWNRKSLARLLQAIGFTNVNFYWTSNRKSWVWLHVDIGKTWNGQEFNYRDMDANSQKVIKI